MLGYFNGRATGHAVAQIVRNPGQVCTLMLTQREEPETDEDTSFAEFLFQLNDLACKKRYPMRANSKREARFTSATRVTVKKISLIVHEIIYF